VVEFHPYRRSRNVHILAGRAHRRDRRCSFPAIPHSVSQKSEVVSLFFSKFIPTLTVAQSDRSQWRLLFAGLYPVEFRDFFLGDMFCSLTYAMGVRLDFNDNDSS